MAYEESEESPSRKVTVTTICSDAQVHIIPMDEENDLNDTQQKINGDRQLVITSAYDSIPPEDVLPKMQRLPTKSALKLVESPYASSEFEHVGTLDGRWIDNSYACEYFTSLLTCVYAITLTIFALVLEVSQNLSNDWLSELIFYLFMYGLSILFFVYFYFFMLYPGWINYWVALLQRKRWIKSNGQWFIEKASHEGIGAASLYLRLGALLFGTIGIILFGLEIFLCIRKQKCRNGDIFKHSMSAVFIFLQMHFVFANAKIVVSSTRRLAKFGFMHLVAVNLWTWFRFVVTKQSKGLFANTSNGAMTTAMVELMTPPPGVLTFNPGISDGSRVAERAIMTGRLLVQEQFSTVATFLITCLVEYSLIGAAVMFILWKTVGQTMHLSGFDRVKRKHKLAIDCSNSTAGLFAGLVFLIGAIVAVGVYTVYKHATEDNGNTNATMVFHIADMVLFVVSCLGCSIGLYRMRTLQYSNHRASNGEQLDRLLLMIGLTGEVAYCSAMIVIWISNGTQPQLLRPTDGVFVYTTRLIEVVVQAVFILMATRLRAFASSAMGTMPGKQFVTFLLVANIAMFFFLTFDGMPAGDEINSIHRIVVVAAMPLTIFYRFHCSVCLAEIWKHCYDAKSGRSSDTISTRTEQSASRPASSARILDTV